MSYRCNNSSLFNWPDNDLIYKVTNSPNVYIGFEMLLTLFTGEENFTIHRIGTNTFHDESVKILVRSIRVAHQWR